MSTHFFIYALLFREQTRPSPRFFLSSIRFVPHILHSSLYSSLNASFMSSFILQRTQFPMQCFHPYKYKRTRCFHAKTRDCDTVTCTYGVIHISPLHMNIYIYIYIYMRKYTSMPTNGKCSVIRKRKLGR